MGSDPELGPQIREFKSLAEQGILPRGRRDQLRSGSQPASWRRRGHCRLAPASGGEGQSVRLTLRQLLRDPPRWHCGGRTVCVCENPAVVAEATGALGPRCTPLVCTSGEPVAAVTTLLRQLGSTAARLCDPGAFDGPGIAIGNRIIGKLGGQPARFEDHDFRQAAGTLACHALTGRPEVPAWDPPLGDTMAVLKRQVHEGAGAPGPAGGSGAR